MAEDIDKSGASQGDLSIGGDGGIMFLSDSHFYKFQAGLGRATNNTAELMALKLVLMLAAQKGVQKFQIWDVLGGCQYGNFFAEAEILYIKSVFNETSFNHVYR